MVKYAILALDRIVDYQSGEILADQDDWDPPRVEDYLLCNKLDRCIVNAILDGTLVFIPYISPNPFI